MFNLRIAFRHHSVHLLRNIPHVSKHADVPVLRDTDVSAAIFLTDQ